MVSEYARIWFIVYDENTTELPYIIYHFIFRYVLYLFLVPSGPPLNLNVRLMSDTSVILTWEQPAQKHRNGEITGYVIRYKGTTVSSNEEMITVGRGVTELELNDLITGESYHFSIAAQTINGTGPYDNVTIVIEGCKSTLK